MHRAIDSAISIAQRIGYEGFITIMVTLLGVMLAAFALILGVITVAVTILAVVGYRDLKSKVMDVAGDTATEISKKESQNVSLDAVMARLMPLVDSKIETAVKSYVNKTDTVTNYGTEMAKAQSNDEPAASSTVELNIPIYPGQEEPDADVNENDTGTNNSGAPENTSC